MLTTLTLLALSLSSGGGSAAPAGPRASAEASDVSRGTERVHTRAGSFEVRAATGRGIRAALESALAGEPGAPLFYAGAE